MDNKKVTLTTEELSTLLVATSMWLATTEDPEDPEIAEMVERGQAVLYKIHDFVEEHIISKTCEDTPVLFDLIAK